MWHCVLCLVYFMASSDVLKLLFNNGVHFEESIPQWPTGPAVSCSHFLQD